MKNFIRLVQHICTDSAIYVAEQDIIRQLDNKGVEELRTASPDTRQSWASAIALRLVRERGIVPTG